MDDAQLGQRLQTLRQQRRLTLRALSRASGIALSHLSALEHGKNSITVASLKRILEALGTNLGAFFSLVIGIEKGSPANLVQLLSSSVQLLRTI